MDNPWPADDPAALVLEALGYPPDHPIWPWVDAKAARSNQSRPALLRDCLSNAWAADEMLARKRAAKRRGLA